MDGPRALIDRLVRATNDHDVEGVAACFAPEYENETPVHPARSFRGRAQVRKNWVQIFAAVPDVRAEVIACVTDGDEAWTEWEMSGTRGDGSAHQMRGVIVFRVGDDLVQSARFYLEPVDPATATVDDAVAEQVVRG
jgi:ketosteroid isomerase-like protein